MEEREVDAELVEVEVPVGVELVVGEVEPDLQQLHLLPPQAPRGARLGQQMEKRRDEERQEELQEEVEEHVVEVVLVQVGGEAEDIQVQGVA